MSCLGVSCRFPVSSPTSGKPKDINGDKKRTLKDNGKTRFSRDVAALLALDQINREFILLGKCKSD